MQFFKLLQLRTILEIIGHRPRGGRVRTEGASLNNLSLAHWAEGRLDQAIDAARRVLDLEPDNIHALSNVIRFTCASGRSDEARPYAERLKASTDAAAFRQTLHAAPKEIMVEFLR
jgi:tetratricopeptide (TPR) repeat protein